jgi:hypothetical protein
VLQERECELSELIKQQGYRTVLAVPMLREGVLRGVITVLKTEVEPFTEKQIELVTTFADQAVIAIENVRLFNEVQARTRELAQSVEELQALGEVTQAVNSTLDLQTVLSTIVTKAVQLSGTEGGAIYVFDELEQLFRLRATYGFGEDLVAAVQDQQIGASDAIRQATQDRQPQEIADIRDEPPSPLREIAMRAGYFSNRWREATRVERERSCRRSITSSPNCRRCASEAECHSQREPRPSTVKWAGSREPSCVGDFEGPLTRGHHRSRCRAARHSRLADLALRVDPLGTEHARGGVPPWAQRNNVHLAIYNRLSSYHRKSLQLRALSCDHPEDGPPFDQVAL